MFVFPSALQLCAGTCFKHTALNDSLCKYFNTQTVLTSWLLQTNQLSDLGNFLIVHIARKEFSQSIHKGVCVCGHEEPAPALVCKSYVWE